MRKGKVSRWIDRIGIVYFTSWITLTVGLIIYNGVV